jgi:hypothetical protein
VAVHVGGDGGDATQQPQDDPIFQMIGVDDVEPADVDDVVYGELDPTGMTDRRTERPSPDDREYPPLTGPVGRFPNLTGDLSTLDFLDDIRGES